MNQIREFENLSIWQNVWVCFLVRLDSFSLNTSFPEKKKKKIKRKYSWPTSGFLFSRIQQEISLSLHCYFASLSFLLGQCCEQRLVCVPLLSLSFASAHVPRWELSAVTAEPHRVQDPRERGRGKDHFSLQYTLWKKE